MSVPFATMSRTYPSSADREPSHLLRKLILLFLLVTAAALGAVLLFRQRPDFPVLLFTFFADVGLGLIAGLGVRTVLRNQNWFVRGVAAAAIVVVGLGVLGYFTDWQVGIGPLEFGRPTADWLDVTQLVIGIDTAWIAVRAWHATSVRTVAASPRPVSRAVPRTSAAGASRIQPSRGWSIWPKARVRANSVGSGRSVSRRPVLSFQKAAAPVARSRRNGLFRRRPQVQLAVVEDHRCPYCLEPVMRSDPRGTKECEVCHTLHHADCWAITGVCQVPHLNT